MTQSLILGLDISTSVTGYSILEDVKDFDSKKNVIDLNAIKFPDVSFWEKTDYVKNILQQLHNKYPNIQKIVVEEPMKRFATGASSVQTIITLQKFNAIICLFCRDLWKVDPSYINVNNARKRLGLKIQQTKKVGKNAKMQTAEWLLTHDFAHVVFPNKRGCEACSNSIETIKSYVFDELDSYVIAHGALQ